VNFKFVKIARHARGSADRLHDATQWKRCFVFSGSGTVGVVVNWGWWRSGYTR